MSWNIVGGPFAQPSDGDAERFEYILERPSPRGPERTGVVVELSGSAMASDPLSFPSPFDETVRTKGRSAVEELLGEASPPRLVVVPTPSSEE